MCVLLCVCLCVHVCICVCMHTCATDCIWQLEDNLGRKAVISLHHVCSRLSVQGLHQLNHLFSHPSWFYANATFNYSSRAVWLLFWMCLMFLQHNTLWYFLYFLEVEFFRQNLIKDHLSGNKDYSQVILNILYILNNFGKCRMLSSFYNWPKILGCNRIINYIFRGDFTMLLQFYLFFHICTIFLYFYGYLQLQFCYIYYIILNSIFLFNSRPFKNQLISDVEGLLFLHPTFWLQGHLDATAFISDSAIACCN